MGSNPTFPTKKCGKCKEIKELSEFHKRGKGFNIWCKSCRKEYDKKYWQENSERRRKQVVSLKKKNWKWLSELKSEMSCSICEENHPSTLDFHHKDPSNKDGTIGEAIQKGWGIDRILTEIKKCDVLCSNCHRKLHWEEKQGSID